MLTATCSTGNCKCADCTTDQAADYNEKAFVQGERPYSAASYAYLSRVRHKYEFKIQKLKPSVCFLPVTVSFFYRVVVKEH